MRRKMSPVNELVSKKAHPSSKGAFTETEGARRKPANELTLMETLNRFREQFTQKSHHEIVFNPQHLLRAFEVYLTQFDGWDWNKRDLFWRQLIGFVQRFLPACDAQAFAQGIYYLTEENEALRRSFDFRYGGGSFYPVDFNSCSSLGFDYAGGPIRAPRRRHDAVVSARVITKFISSKNSQLGKLMQIN